MGEFDTPEEVEEKYKEVVIEIGKQQTNIKHQLRSNFFTQYSDLSNLVVQRGTKTDHFQQPW